ncbi:hypothetical protein NP945_11705 [Mesorhizobium sp. LMG17149]|uniref:hypothetical protein n=1 Tax=Mesorhizobium sp. LMG17149 TaxID=2968497 RepID=UPI002117CE32|nr:hypothetical protein [Mesorhizobium sp. LMG17149]MCQ8872486.1 hypothetical protein [Mesorhizobium sp. LMG17149]
MDDKNQHLEDLQEFRAIYVSERRNQIRTALDLRKSNGDGGMWGQQLKALQEIIEAVDRAIADEQDAEPSVYEKRGLRTID